MSDDEIQAADDNDREPTTVSGDPLFNFLVHLAEKKAPTRITLYSQGLVFTGVLASQAGYFEAMRNHEASGPFSPVFEAFLKELDKDDADGDAPAPDYKYVHLLEGQVIAPGSKGMPVGGFPIRLLRSAITGWSLGSLQLAN